MALDTANKRFSAVNVGNPWRGPTYFPTGTVDASERLAVLWLYSGIAAGAEAPVDVGNAVESFIPIVFASRLDRIKHLPYVTLLSDATTEADTNRVWAKRNWPGIIRIRVGLVPL
jgi:hypothetical protein